jgi:hypothetical protein
MKKITKYPHLFWLWLTRPYPFQLWAAPRKKKWCFSRPEAEPKRKSPPGFSFGRKDKPVEYAMYLYPDSIHTYWMIYFMISVPLHIFLDCFVAKEMLLYKYIAGFFLFIISYCLIYIYQREPVLDELWIFWADTEQQKKYFKNITSRITFDSCKDMKEYEGLNAISFDIKDKVRFTEKSKYIIDFICICISHLRVAAKFLSLESFIFRRFVFMKSSYYTNSPVFFNTQGSIQEGLLRAAIADFFADKKKFMKNIFIYYVPHVWISFLYLSANLLFIFRWHPYKNQNETIPLLILIVSWAVVSMPILFKQYMSIKLFYDYDEKLFRFAPKIVSNLSKKKMRLNDNFVKSFDPKKTFGLLHAAAFGSYLVILNLVMQYEDPSKTETNKPAAEQKVENQCRNVQQVNIIESSPCQEKCCLKIIAE